jgi:hypothetical protein
MQSTWMTMSDRFLPRRSLVDGVERQGHFDEFLFVRHWVPSILYMPTQKILNGNRKIISKFQGQKAQDGIISPF